MLTDLSFLDEGQNWPPESELGRLDMYDKNTRLFNSEHADVYQEAFRRIQRVIGNWQEVVSYPVIVNFQKKISLKTADFLWTEPPKIVCGASDSSEQQAINQIIENCDLVNTGYENTVDISRFGDGILQIYKDGDHGVIDVIDPSMWFLVVDSHNIKRVLYHVLAWVSESEDAQHRKHKYLTYQVHEKGKYTESVREITARVSAGVSEVLGPKIQADQVFDTGLSDFAILQASNIMTSDRCYGYDDYTDIDSLVSEILVRVAQISRVLDKHAAPSVRGPLSALEKDPKTGEYHLKMGNYFPRADKDDVPVEYITWDASLEAAFKHLDLLVMELAVMSEMGSALFDSAEKTREAVSGTALRLRYMQLLTKVKRLSLRYSPVIIKAIKLCSELGGKNIVPLTDKSIGLTWQDGLPNDEKESAEIMAIRTGQKPTLSQRQAIQRLDDVSEKSAEETYQKILDEEADRTPVPLGGNLGESNILTTVE